MRNSILLKTLGCYSKDSYYSEDCHWGGSIRLDVKAKNEIYVKEFIKTRRSLSLVSQSVWRSIIVPFAQSFALAFSCVASFRNKNGMTS